jgi:hypothetical protein
MNAPAQHHYLLGHRAVLGLLLVGTWMLTMRCLSGPGSFIPPLIGFYLVRKSVRSKRLTDAHAQWQHAWDRMAGIEPTTRPPRRRLRVPKALVWIGWACLYLWLRMHADEPTTVGYAALLTFWILLSAWGFVSLLVSAVRRMRRRSVATGHGKSEPVVSVCLSVPSGSPAPGQMISMLPDYARALLQTSGAQRASA